MIFDPGFPEGVGPNRVGHARNHRGHEIHAGKRTRQEQAAWEERRKDMLETGAILGAGGAVLGALLNPPPMVHGTMSEFMDPGRLGQMGAGALLTGAIGFGVGAGAEYLHHARKNRKKDQI